MKKQSSSSASCEDTTGIMTRSRAATLALRSCGFVASRAPAQQNRKRVLRENSKRVPLDENNTNVAGNHCRQHKRRAVLEDVTNVCCESSYRSCFQGAKIQVKNNKQAKCDQPVQKQNLNDKKEPLVSHVAPSVSVELQHVQATSKARSNKGIEKAKPKRQELSISLDTDVAIRLSSTLDYATDIQRPSQLHTCKKKVEDEDFSGKSMMSCYPDHIDIDSDQTDPQLCSLYAADIYSNLRVAELNRRPFPHFMEIVQRDITQTMRGILVDWLVEVSEEYKLVPDTLYMTVYLIDWFLSQNYIERQRLQLLGITCMLIASKYEEICAPRVEEFCFITDNTYSREVVLKMENQVLKHFSFQLFAPTTKTFLRRFLRAAQVSYKSPSLELECLANFLAELSLVDYGCINFLPSIIAASAVFLARWTLDQSSHPWNATLEHYTSYQASDLKVSAFALQDLQLNTNGCPLSAIRMKYRQEKFKSVATLSSPKLLETLF